MSARPTVTFLDGATLNAPIGGARAMTACFDEQLDAAPSSNAGHAPQINQILPTEWQGRFGRQQRPCR